MDPQVSCFPEDMWAYAGSAPGDEAPRPFGDADGGMCLLVSTVVECVEDMLCRTILRRPFCTGLETWSPEDLEGTLQDWALSEDHALCANPLCEPGITVM